MDLKGKVAIISGGAAGIGREACILFSVAGAKVVVADLDVVAGEKTVADIRAAGGEAIFVAVDVSNTEQVQNMVAVTVETYGRIDVLYNNAGIECFGNVVAVEEKVWQKCMDVNVKGTYLCSKYVIPEMIKSGGGQ